MTDPTMKIGFDSDEWYPVFDIATPNNYREPEVFLDLTEAEIQDFKEVTRRFKDWQYKIRYVYKDK